MSEEENDYWFQYGWDEAKRKAEDAMYEKMKKETINLKKGSLWNLI